MEKYENRKVHLIRSGSLPSYERLKKNLLAKYRQGFCIFVKIRARVDKNNKKRAGKETRAPNDNFRDNFSKISCLSGSPRIFEHLKNAIIAHV